MTAARDFMRLVDQRSVDPSFRHARNVVLDFGAGALRDLNLEDALTTFVYLALMDRGVSTKTLQALLAIDTGKTWKVLKGFPKRLKKMAGEIEAVNAGIFFCPLNLITSRTVTGRALRAQLPLLPVTLRAHAVFVQSVISKLPLIISNYFGPGMPQRGHSAWILRVSNLVKILTGRFHDAEVSDLLNAADLTLNPNRKEPRFHPQTLADLRSRGKRHFRRT